MPAKPPTDQAAVAAASGPPSPSPPPPAVMAEDVDTDPLSPANFPKTILDIKSFMENLQDEGKMSKGEPKEMVYPRVKKLAGLLHTKWLKTNLIQFEANKSRAYKAVVGIIISLCLHMDLVSVLPALKIYASGKNAEKMYVLLNDDTGGQRKLVHAAIKFFHSKQNVTIGQRNPSLAVRVAWCICHDTVQKAAIYWRANKKTRSDLDQCHSATLAFGDVLLKLFHDNGI